MQDCLFYSAHEIAGLLGVSRAKAYRIVKELNEELSARGYIVVAGKIPKKFLAEKFYGLAL